MPISFRRPVAAGPALFLPALLLSLLVIILPVTQAIAQDAPAPPTKFDQFLTRFDLGVSAAGSLTNTVSGIEQRDLTTTHSTLSIRPSTTVGELATITYTARPWVGFEFNFGNSRYTENYTFTPPPPQSLIFNNAQVGVHEETLGYVAHPPHTFFGIQPFFGAGGGTMAFHPTRGGGEGLPFQYRAAYYYSLGLQDQFPDSHFGMRLGFRQIIYLAPDFQENYLTITRRVRTSEPTIGFYLRF